MSLEIADYGLIGDCETAALVGRDGSIDWLCWPRFDSGACFAALLGSARNGRWCLAPEGAVTRSARRYRGDTLILETEFETASGAVRLTDFMPLRGDQEVSDLVRIVTGLRGQVPMTMELALRFDYGRLVPWISPLEGGNRLRAVAGPHAVVLEAPVPVKASDGTITARFSIAQGQTLGFVLAHEASHLPPPRICDAERALTETEAYWTDWASRCTYDGPWREAVLRSLITTKSMTYRPTGGIIAATTTSLPEEIGGSRNWDYRFCWLRDATFTLHSLVSAGYRTEAEHWCDWLLRAVAGAAHQAQPLYGIDGTHRCEEIEAHWLPGYRGSSPVRIGNAAYAQLQVDIFGSVIDTLHQARCHGLEMHEASAGLQNALLSHLEEIWRQPDEGIWEVRSERRHFVHGKLMSWVAFDRAVASARRFGLEGPIARWEGLRNEIREEILTRGFDSDRGAFVQAYGTTALDASTLLIPLFGFLPANDPRMRSTVAAIERDLTRDGLVLRYDPDEAVDGLPGDEGAFLACSFWLADNMILQGRHDEARALFARLLSLRNDLGLLSEQYDWKEGRLVGNFPQAFSHFSLIDTALNLGNHPGDQTAAAKG
ncbi:glycoside hydrolase family 15 protein [Plastorhodobacter daqingensis]|uniref:Glycoside hydrolase family 15 protein n=1 Tax=Plastorhodobacter daqingensis TaxID=1387281 RepID=A0ABW2UNH4_9RHOB